MASFDDLYPTKNEQKDDSEDYSKIGTMHSMLAGVGSGLISIPKGLFSLGATLMDLGAGTNKAAEVEKWFDDLTEWDEKAEATTAGKITEALVNIGVPGAFAFSKGAALANTALRAKKLEKYFTLDNPNIVKAAKKAKELNFKGRTTQFIAGATSGGMAEGVFVGDVEQIGTFGDLLGGPTEIDRDEDYDPQTELLNRVKFGTEGALFTGIIGGTGLALKKLAKTSKYMRNSHRKEDQLIDKIASYARARGKRPEDFFTPEMRQRGLRDADINLAKQTSRELDKNMDAVFGLLKPMFDPLKRKARADTLEQANEALLSGAPRVKDLTKGGVKVEFDLLKPGEIIKVGKKEIDLAKILKDNGADKEKIENIFNNLNVIRTGWGEMFSSLGGKLRGSDISKFKKIVGSRFKDYFEQRYDVFQNRTLIPFLGYQPSKEAIEQARSFMMDVARKKGRRLTEGEADKFIERIHSSAKMPREIDDGLDPYFEIPNFFVNKSILNEKNVRAGTAKISDFVEKYKMGNGTVVSPKNIAEEILGKNKNPMQTMLAGTGKITLLTRRNEFFRDILNQSDEVLKKFGNKLDPNTGKKYERLFYDSLDDAKDSGIFDAKRISVMDPGGKLDIGVSNPLLNKYAIPEVVDALEETSKNLMKDNMGLQIYSNLVLFPKATSQMAKTILSPVTHMRNFVSAGAFASANGIIPFADPTAVKTAYQALQIPFKGARKKNDLYRRLLELNVVNSNVRLGDQVQLMKDTGWGDLMNYSNGFRMLLKPFSKIKQFSEDLYTAEDDYWKVYSWAVEKSRLGKAYGKHGIKRTAAQLEQEAADIVKHQIPNYAYVSDFVKTLRRAPIGNFVSFPAEIMRTSTNIVRRALHEINYTVDGVKPLKGIGYRRLVGMGLTTAAIPAAATKAAQMIYNVTEDEMEALRRYVPDWSKNSTLIPVRKEDGDLKYIDFSHANAYDTIVRPFQAVLNNVAAGNADEDGMMDDFMLGVWDATKELGSPFISESIWTEAASDIIMRLGRTREGTQVYNEEDTPGDKNVKIMKHLVKSQMPFSWEQLKRLDVAIKPVDIIQDLPGEFDKYGQTYELGDEMLGFLGMRRVELNPTRGLDFKIADYQRGVRNSRSLFTRATRLGAGPVTPKEIVDAYINANRALFEVRSSMMKDYDAAQLLGVNEESMTLASRRLSKRDYGTIREGIFRPLPISKEVALAFAENSAKMGATNPLEVALPVLNKIQEMLSLAPLSLEMFPQLFNPFDEEEMAEGGRVGYLAGGEVEDPEDEASAAAAWITEPEEIKEIFKHDFREYFLSNIWKSKPKPPMSAGTAGAQAKAPMDINTPKIDPSLLGKGPNTINNVEITRTGLTETENALLSNEEKAIRLRQRGIG